MDTFDIRIQADTLELSENWERVILFDEDMYGYLCFLWPFFEDLAKRTGQFVEREGDAVYGGACLKDLVETLADAKAALEQKPENWQQHIFTRVLPHHELVYSTLNKNEMRKIITTLESATEKAKANGLYITFWD